MPGDILNGIWTVFFHPGQVSQICSQSYAAIDQSIHHSPRQIILRSYWQICGSSLRLSIVVGRTELDRGRRVHIHVILVVRHFASIGIVNSLCSTESE